MPWCPKCKNEYKDGIDVCSDCGCKLVESLEDEMETVYYGEKEELEPIFSFMQVSGILDVQMLPSDEDNLYEIFVSAGEVAQAKKLLRIYLKDIAEKKGEEKTAENTETIEKEHVYETAKKKEEDYRTGANTLLFVGALGVVVLILMNLNVISIPLPSFNKILITCVMGALFVLFLILGILSRKTCKKLKGQMEQEENLQDRIRTWADTNLKKEDIDENLEGSELSEGELYYKRIAMMKERVTKEFPDASATFIDYVLEELYSRIYDE